MVDGDDTYPAEFVHKLIEPVRLGRADMAVGDRRTTGGYNGTEPSPLSQCRKCAGDSQHQSSIPLPFCPTLCRDTGCVAGVSSKT